MNALPRIITQVVLVGGRIVGRAFVEAYKSAAENSAKNAISASQGSKDSLTRLTGMTVDEAKKILHLEGPVLSAAEKEKVIQVKNRNLSPGTMAWVNYSHYVGLSASSLAFVPLLVKIANALELRKTI
jgi:import inner membrane translocase subunit TIM16